MDTWEIVRLNKTHERAAFASGSAPLDQFLKTLVSQYEKKHLGRTYVATRPGEVRVLGYYTVSSGSFSLSSLPEKARKKLPHHPVPTIHLGRLAVDQSTQGRGLGKTLLFHFLYRAYLIAQQLGVHAVDVIALDDAAKAFYTRYGFIRLETDDRHLYLPMKTVEQMFADASQA